MKRLFWLFTMLALPGLLGAQTPCADNFKKGLRKNETYTAPCDSMVVFSKKAFENSQLQLRQLQRQVALHEKGVSSLNRSLALRDSLVQVYQKEVRDFERYLQDTAGPIARLQGNLEKSIQNTDRVIGIAKRHKILGIVTGSLAGLIVGAVVF